MAAEPTWTAVRVAEPIPDGVSPSPAPLGCDMEDMLLRILRWIRDSLADEARTDVTVPGRIVSSVADATAPGSWIAGTVARFAELLKVD